MNEASWLILGCILPALVLVALAVWIVVMMERAPMGEEIEGVGFVYRKEDDDEA